MDGQARTIIRDDVVSAKLVYDELKAVMEETMLNHMAVTRLDLASNRFGPGRRSLYTIWRQIWKSRKWYGPHQSERERARRVRQLREGKLS